MKIKILLSLLLVIQQLSFSTAQASGSDQYFGTVNYESEIGLYNNRARYYDPETGTFITKDPVGVTGGLNTYQYAEGDPVNIIDPSGLYVGVDDAVAAGIGALVGLGAQGVGDLISGELSSWQDYTAAGVGGAAGGVAFLYTGPVGAALAGGAVTNLSRQGLNLATGQQDSFSVSGAVVETATAGVLTFAGGKAGEAILPAVAQRLPSSLKGDIGEFLTENAARLRGETILGTQVRYDLPGVFTPTGRQAFSRVDVVSENRIGDIFFNEAKFGTSTLTSNQKILSNIEPNFRVDQWDYNFVSSAGNAIGSAFGFGTSQAALNTTQVGGVLIDQAAELIGTNLMDIQGATFDPLSRQLIFLGEETSSSVEPINLDYMFTAIQAVYGSATPPLVSLDPPLSALTSWVNFGNGDNVFEPNEWGGFVLRYNPVWDKEDTTFNIKVRGQSGGVPFEWEALFDAVALDGPPLTVQNGLTGRFAMRLVFNSWVTPPPSGVVLDTSPFLASSLSNFSFTLSPNSQDSHFQFNLFNGSSQNYVIQSVQAFPARQHRRFGGRVEMTRLGWVMYEADRVMKCLSIGKDNLTGAEYNSSTITIPNFENFVERIQSTGLPGGNFRMWFVPNEMTLERHVDEESSQATIVFTEATVALLTESFIEGLPQSPLAVAFTQHFNTNYDAFAQMEFPVQDPTDPTGNTIINVRIFEMLREVMQAVSLARFMRDNNIPVDLWWLNTWEPPTTYIPRSTPTAMNEDAGIIIFGGIEVNRVNDYIPSLVAQTVGQEVCSARPDLGSQPEGDLDEQVWTAPTTIGNVKSVAFSQDSSMQNGNYHLTEVDLKFDSLGEDALEFSRSIQSGYIGENHLGAGWRMTRFVMEFSRPSWFDEQDLFLDGNDNPISTDVRGDTRLRSGVIRVVDLATGAVSQFVSSMQVSRTFDALGNSVIEVQGLNANAIPDFTAGTVADGSTLIQNDTTSKSYLFTTPSGYEIEFDYEGRLLKTTDISGFEKSYVYDSNNCLESITDGSQTIDLNYDADLKLEYITGPNGERVDYSYDAQGCLQTVTHQRSGASVTYAYNDDCQFESKSYFNGIAAFQATPDLQGRAGSNMDEKGNILNRTFTQDANSQVRKTTISDPLSTGTREIEFDNAGRVLSSKDISGSALVYGYDEGSVLPNQLRFPMANRALVSIERNGVHRPTRVEDPANTGSQAIVIDYHSTNGEVTRFEDYDGRATEIDYDSENRIECVRKFLGSTPVENVFTYEAGQVKTHRTPMNYTTTFMRDSMGRLSDVIDPTNVTTSYEYDALGRLWKIHDPRISGEVVFIYDNYDRLDMVQTPLGNIDYTYDPATGFLTRIEDLLGRAIRFEHDLGTGEITKAIRETSAGDKTTTLKYNRFGDIEELTLPDAQTITFNTDDVGRFTGIAETSASGPGAPEALKSNNATDGVITNIHDHIFTWAAPASNVPVVGYSFALDSLPDEVQDAGSTTTTLSSVANGTHTFQVRAVDADGNWGPPATFDLLIDDTQYNYEIWLREYFTQQEIEFGVVTAADANPDDDGLSNLLEYAFVSDPIVSSETASTDFVFADFMGDAYPAIQFRRRINFSPAPDITYILESSDELTNWGGLSLGTYEVQTTPIDSEVEDVVVRDNVKIDDAVKRFLRARVTKP